MFKMYKVNDVYETISTGKFLWFLGRVRKCPAGHLHFELYISSVAFHLTRCWLKNTIKCRWDQDCREVFQVFI